MKAKDLADTILNTGIVYDEFNNEHYLKSSIDKKEGDLLRKIVDEIKPINSIEIGCAYGISALYICSVLEDFKEKAHTIIDPYQSTQWKNIGRLNLNRAGIDFLKIIEIPSEIVLPRLVSEGKSFDFGFIDGYHTFDHTLVDFFYIDRLISIGGVIAIDDTSWPSINKVIRYVNNNYKNYTIVDQVKIKYSIKRNVFEKFIKYPITTISKVMPPKFRYEILSDKTIQPDKKIKLNSSMIVLKKTGIDTRKYNDFNDF